MVAKEDVLRFRALLGEMWPEKDAAKEVWPERAERVLAWLRKQPKYPGWLRRERFHAAEKVQRELYLAATENRDVKAMQFLLAAYMPDKYANRTQQEINVAIKLTTQEQVQMLKQFRPNSKVLDLVKSAYRLDAPKAKALKDGTDG